MSDLHHLEPLSLPKVRISSLDLSVSPATVAQTLNLIAANSRRETPTLIGAHNLHSAYLYHTDNQFRRFCDDAHVILVDGWPILAALQRERNTRYQPELTSAYRIGSTDWIAKAIELPEVTRVCVIGASAQSNSMFISRQRANNPSVEFFGHPADPWVPGELEDLIAAVNEFQPHLTIIGMGMPLQEQIARSLAGAGAPGVIATVGGAIDQLSGAQKNAPRWMGKMRVEWLWRLATNPRRLAHRYLVEPFKLRAALQSSRRANS